MSKKIHQATSTAASAAWAGPKWALAKALPGSGGMTMEQVMQTAEARDNIYVKTSVEQVGQNTREEEKQQEKGEEKRARPGTHNVFPELYQVMLSAQVSNRHKPFPTRNQGDEATGKSNINYNYTHMNHINQERQTPLLASSNTSRRHLTAARRKVDTEHC